MAKRNRDKRTQRDVFGGLTQAPVHRFLRWRNAGAAAGLLSVLAGTAACTGSASSSPGKPSSSSSSAAPLSTLANVRYPLDSGASFTAHIGEADRVVGEQPYGAKRPAGSPWACAIGVVATTPPGAATGKAIVAQTQSWPTGLTVAGEVPPKAPGPSDVAMQALDLSSMTRGQITAIPVGVYLTDSKGVAVGSPVAFGDGLSLIRTPDGLELEGNKPNGRGVEVLARVDCGTGANSGGPSLADNFPAVGL